MEIVLKKKLRSDEGIYTSGSLSEALKLYQMLLHIRLYLTNAGSGSETWKGVCGETCIGIFDASAPGELGMPSLLETHT